MQNRKLRMGMVGGGEGAFIGNVHRMAANLDGQIELVCGAFSSDPEKSIRSGKSLYLPEDRCYSTYEEMFACEMALDKTKRMDFVSIVTPNHLHFDVAKKALEHGFHVICDKPATFSLEQAIALKDIIVNSGCLFGLTHTYTGYPMVRHAKHLIQRGDLGTIRVIQAEYPQDWLTTKTVQNFYQL